MQNLENEIWTNHSDYIGLYQASNLGRVKSFYKKGGAANKNFNGIIKPKLNAGGYLSFTPSKEGKQIDYLVHRFIIESFLFNDSNLSTVNHKNGIKTDNRIENLEWCSLQDNLKHALDNGLRECKGICNGRSVLNENDVIKARIFYKTGNYSVKDILQFIKKGTRGTLQRAIQKTTWKHL